MKHTLDLLIHIIYMNAVSFLFPSKHMTVKNSLLLLVVRIVFGCVFISHGISKLLNFDTLSLSFPDPLHIGHTMSLCLVIFAELFCTMGFIFGFLYRLALIPMLFTMIMASFVILGGQPFSQKELPLLYLVVFIVMYIAGPGEFAFDRLFIRLKKPMRKEKDKH